MARKKLPGSLFFNVNKNIIIAMVKKLYESSLSSIMKSKAFPSWRKCFCQIESVSSKRFITEGHLWYKKVWKSLAGS